MLSVPSSLLNSGTPPTPSWSTVSLKYLLRSGAGLGTNGRFNFWISELALLTVHARYTGTGECSVSISHSLQRHFGWHFYPRLHLHENQNEMLTHSTPGHADLSK
jgi:hypothetical protein